MQKTLVAQCIPSVCPNRCHASVDVAKFSPLQRPSCALRLKSSKWGLDAQRRRQLITSSSNGRPRIVCLFDGIEKLFGRNAKDAAKKAIDKAVEGAGRAFNNWKEVSRKRAADMGGNDEDGFGGVGRYGGGRYGGGGGGDPEDVEEYDDGWNTFLAFAVFIYLYMKMRGRRFTRCHTPYTDFDAISLWTDTLIRRLLDSEVWDLLQFSFLYAKILLLGQRQNEEARKIALNISKHRSPKVAVPKSTH